MRLNICRRVFFCALWVLVALLNSAFAQTAQLKAPERSLMVPQMASAFELPLNTPLDPETIWQQQWPSAQATNSQGAWQVNAGYRTASKFTLHTSQVLAHTLEVPLVRIDRVDVFWRAPGQAWRTAAAGDTVPLSQWPLVGQFPSVVLSTEGASPSVDVILVMKNAGHANAPVVINSDRESREQRLLQANVAGLLIGASAMVTLVTILMLVTFHGIAAAFLVAYCTAITLGTAILSGYFAIWFTGDMPLFNDASKPFIGSLIATTMLIASIYALDRSYINAWLRRLAWTVALLVMVYALLQIKLLPFSWRLGAGVGTAFLCTALILGIAWNSWIKGDRYAQWVMLSAVCFIGSIVVVGLGYLQLWGIDVYSLLLTVFLLISSLLLRYAIITRERFGRAVMGRAAINRYRDPLTALLSYEGFEREVDNLSLRQNSVGGIAHVLYFSLTELDNFKNEDGYVVWQRDLVRFAAVLQRVLGEDWHIARLSNSKFGAVRLSGQLAGASEPLLTLVLSHCARKIDTYGWVDRVGLRMAGVNTPLTSAGLKESLRVMEDSVQELEHGKRIAVL